MATDRIQDIDLLLDKAEVAMTKRIGTDCRRDLGSQNLNYDDNCASWGKGGDSGSNRTSK